MNFDKAHKRLDEFPDIIDKALITRKEFRYCIHSILEALENKDNELGEKELSVEFLKMRHKIKAEYEERKEHSCFYRCKAEAFERDAMSLRKDLDACRERNKKKNNDRNLPFEKLLEEIGRLKGELDEKHTCRHSDKVIKHLKERLRRYE